MAMASLRMGVWVCRCMALERRKEGYFNVASERVSIAAVSPLCRVYLRENGALRTLRNRETRGRAVLEQQLGAEYAVERDPIVVSEALPSDSVAMHFKAEGTLAENAVPKLTKSLEALDGVTDVSVTVSKAGVTVELTKQMSIQETGVASSLVEVLQKAGFQLQNLNLGFDDDGDEDLYDYDLSTSADEDSVTAS